jgi:hypothetical protein
MILILAAENYSTLKVHNIYTIIYTRHSAALFRTSDRLIAGLYLTTHETLKRQTSMLSAGFEPELPASERPQTHGLDRATTGIGISFTQIS